MKLDVVVSYIALFAMSLGPIYYGSYRSLTSKKTEKISSKEAIYYPVVMSVVLFGLYLVMKFIREDLVNQLLSFYFLAVGVYAICVTVSPLITFILPFTSTWLGSIHLTFFLRLLNRLSLGYLYRTKKEQKWETDVHIVDILGYIVGLALSIWYVLTKHWILTNLIGECYSVTFIELCELGSFKNGFYLLGGLFLYDVFWVYGTDVMVTVAKKIDAPVKLMWPKKDNFGMLGLGDIVIPGIFIALMYRFDEYLAEQKRQKDPENRHLYKNEGKYFMVSFVFYIISFLVGLVVLTVFQSAQPMMFYFVPALLLSVLVYAILKDELKDLVFYDEEDKDEKDEEEEGESDDEDDEDYVFVENDDDFEDSEEEEEDKKTK